MSEFQINVEGGSTVRLPTGGKYCDRDILVTATGGMLSGFHMVRFFNDDRTTLLYTVFVPTGASVIYAGESPVSTEDESKTFIGFEPSGANITVDTDCYAVYEVITTLEETSWKAISALSDKGIAQNYFAVGDTKTIHIEGTVGTLEVNGDYGVYILGFDHNEELEGSGIHFGTFKSKSGNNLVNSAFVDSKYNSPITTGEKYFNANHWGNYNYGGWAGCDLRYDILGSTDVPPSGYGSTPTSGREGFNPSPTCATNPVGNTLMSALPSELRVVMKPMTKYTNNVGDAEDTAEKVTSTIDFLPLLAEYEVSGTRTYSNSAEKNKQSRYDYFTAGNSYQKYCHSNLAITAFWLYRSPTCSSNAFVRAYTMVSAKIGANNPIGLAPIFKV